MNTCLDHIFRFFEATLVPLAWPLVVVFAFIFFRNPISEGLKNFKLNFGKDKSLEVTTDHKQSGDAVEKLPEFGNLAKSTSTSSDFTPLKDDPDLKSWEDNITALLKQNNVTDENEINARLLRATAHMSRSAYIETLATNIYGTQLGAIYELIKYGPHKESTIAHWYRDHEERAGSAAYLTFDDWMEYLITNRLVEVVNDDFQVTDDGKTLATIMRGRRADPENGY